MIEIKQSSVRIALDAQCIDPSRCGGCTLCAGKPSVHKIDVPSDIPGKYSPGQKVAVKRFIINEAFSAFILFGLPLICAFLAVLLVNKYFPLFPQPGTTIASSLAGLFAGVFIAIIFDKVIRKDYPAVIIDSDVME